jgi:hypothetical protein
LKETIMTTALHTSRPGASDTDRVSSGRMDPWRKIALAGGIAYLITFAASIPQLKLYERIVDDPAGYITGAGSNSAVLWGSILEVITALSGIATAVALYPATRRISRTASLGFVTSRVVEAAMILVGVLGILSVVTLQARYSGATGAEAAALQVTGESLVSMRTWTFLLGPGVVAGVNALLLGYVMYRGRLVPRVIPTVGLIGAPLILFSCLVVIFGGWEQMSGPGTLLAMPVAAWEFSLGVYLTVKGFKNPPRTLTTV